MQDKAIQPITHELVLPHNDEYELEFLAELLFTRDKSRFGQLLSASEDYLYYRHTHKKLAQWAKSLHRDGLVPPLVIHGSEGWPWGVLASAVKNKDPQLWDAGGRKALATMWEYFCPNGPTEWLLDQLIALSVARERISIMEREIQSRQGRLSKADEEELWRKTDEEIRKLSMERQARSAMHVGLEDGWAALKADRKRLKDDSATKLGIPTIDSDMGGLIPGELVMLCARAGVGKTTFAANVCFHQLEDIRLESSDDWIVVFSMDMAAKAFIGQVLMRATRLPWREIADEQSPLIERVSETVSTYQNIRVYDNPGLTVDEIITHTLSVQSAMNNQPPRMVIIDHHGKLLSSSTRKNLSMYEVASETYRGIKRAAQELKTVILLLVQLSRRAGEGDTKPTLDMLRDSGVGEEEGDLVLGAWRPRMNRELQEDDVLSLCVLKARRMARKEIECVWNRHVSLVEEMHKETGVPF